MRFEMQFSGATDQGLVRADNEDAFAAVAHRQASGLKSGAVLIVADGMGGHAAGEIASRTIVERLVAFADRHADLINDELHTNTLRHLIAAELLDTEEQLRELGQQDPARRGMGTTVTAAFLANDRLLVAHAGDSRCYLLRRGELQQVTSDHSMAAYFRAKGYGLSDAELAIWEHQLWNVLGGSADPVQPEFRTEVLQPQDLLLLCSDGLTKELDDFTIASMLTASSDSDAVCQALVAEARRRGGSDNITAVVGRFQAVSTGTPVAAPTDTLNDTLNDSLPVNDSSSSSQV